MKLGFLALVQFRVAGDRTNVAHHPPQMTFTP